MTPILRWLALPLVLLGCGSSRTTPPSSASKGVITAFEGVLSHTGQPRDIDALRGHPTVLWFFPMAGTPG